MNFVVEPITSGRVKSDCDNAFYANMAATCGELFAGGANNVESWAGQRFERWLAAENYSGGKYGAVNTYTFCKAAAYIYYKVVAKLGDSAWLAGNSYAGYALPTGIPAFTTHRKEGCTAVIPACEVCNTKYTKPWGADDY